jgi:Putative transposase/Transposase zinc-binding domain
VHDREPSPRAAPKGRPLLEVADIVRAHGEGYLHRHAVSAAERRVLRDIASCRTAVLGGHADVCGACGHCELSYNSCRNRHCPKCQSLSHAKWITARAARLLPTHHFHVVFTLPAELRALAFVNREKVFNLLFASAAQTLLELGHDPKRLGALLGITAVLHTWSRDLSFHPHLHCIVTGGGLSLDGERWVACRRDYFMPVKVLGALFRGKMLDALRQAYDRGAFVLSGGAAALSDPTAFAALLDALYQKRWVVYAKPPFGGAEQVFRYLGRYTHRVGLSNHRLLSMDTHGVRFRTRGDKAVTLAPEEFLRRFLMHVLPKGFVKIRHYGLLSSSHATTTLEVARSRLVAAPARALASPASTEPARATDWRARLAALTGIDVSRCPRCGHAPRMRCPLSVADIESALACEAPDTS